MLVAALLLALASMGFLAMSVYSLSQVWHWLALVSAVAGLVLLLIDFFRMRHD